MRAANSSCRRWLVFVACIVLLVGLGSAQAQVTTGSITGFVTDETDAALPGVSVAVQNVETGQTRNVVTNAQGRYQATGLPPGRYAVTAELAGFATINRTGITVNVGSAVDVPMKMQIAGVQETVTVTGEGPLIESTKTGLSNIVSREAIDSLPSKDQQYLDFALLMPATSENVTRVQGTGAVIGGARSKEGTLLVDGFYNLDEGFTMVKQRHSQDTIQEFQLVTFGGAAEYGRAIGGVINAVTKSGTNRFRGTGYGFYRDKNLNSQAFEEKLRGSPKSAFTRRQWGGTFGGPIIQDKSFFFGAFERVNANAPFDNGIKKEDGEAIGLPPEDVGTVPRWARSIFVFGKWDHNIDDTQRLMASFSYTDITDHQLTYLFPLGARSYAQQLPFVDWAYTVAWTKVAREGRMLHDVKVSYFPRDYHSNGLPEGGPPLVPDGQLNQGDQTPSSPPTVRISSVANFGSATLQNHIKTYPVQAIYSSSIFTENHSFKFGTDYMYAYYDYNQYSPLHGAYSFSSLANFLAGKYSTYTQSFGATSNPRTHQYFSAFVQDSWVASDRLTMNYGLRYDLELNPTQKESGIPYGNDYNNFGPRFGLSYDLTDQGKTFLKVTTGLYYDRIWNNSTNDLYSLKDHELRVSATWRPGDPGAPVYPEVFSVPPEVIPGSVHDVVVMPTEVNVPTSAQVVATIEHALTPTLALSASAIYTRSWFKEYRWDDNLEWDPATQSYFRPDPNYRRIRRYRYDAPAEYFGGIFELERRGRRVGFNGNLTLARSYETAGVFSAPNDQRLGIRADWGPQPDTPAARGVVSGWYSFNDNIQVSGSFRARTGLPIDPSASGLDLNGDGNFGDRTPGLDPFSFRAPGNATVDVRFTWAFPFANGDQKFQLYVESFNLLNRANVRSVDSNYGPDASQPKATWLRPLSYFSPREVQLGAKLTF